MDRVLLVNTPWSSIHRPVIGISLLKAAAGRHGFAVDIRYFNLLWAQFCFGKIVGKAIDVATAEREFSLPIVDLLFQGCHNNCMVDEWVFSQYVFGDKLPNADDFIENFLSKEYSPEEMQIWLGLRALVQPFLEACLASVEWERYSVVGLTSVFRQQLASLQLA